MNICDKNEFTHYRQKKFSEDFEYFRKTPMETLGILVYMQWDERKGKWFTPSTQPSVRELQPRKYLLEVLE